jgi:anti-sigma factor RsiW
MSCHKATRALLDHFRFGEELDASCDEYLRHVESCVDCQHEIAVDRGMAADLRRSLHQRVDGFEPSPAVWRALRLQAADPEPRRWWNGVLETTLRGMRVMVPVSALMLAAVLSWSNQSNGISDAASGDRGLASRLQWSEQMTVTARVEVPEHRMPDVIPAPSINLPRPSGDMPYADTPTAIKVFNMAPTGGGVIR